MKPRKQPNCLHEVSSPEQELARLMTCARWLTVQFETIGQPELGRLYHKALIDAEAWLQAKALTSDIHNAIDNDIMAQEAQIIHRILMKYAALSDAEEREAILEEMGRLTHGAGSYGH